MKPVLIDSENPSFRHEVFYIEEVAGMLSVKRGAEFAAV